MDNNVEYNQYFEFEDNHWWFRGRREILSVFLSYIKNVESKSILEVGCGTGGNLKYLFKQFNRLVGIDNDSYALELAKKKLVEKADIKFGDANNLLFPPNTFDCVALLDTLYHVKINNPSKVLSDVYRILKPNGYLLISDGAFNFLAGRHSQAVNSARRFTKNKLVTYLNDADYRIIKTSYWGFSLFFLLFFKRTLFERIIKPKNDENKLDLISIPIIDSLLYFTLYCEKIILGKINLALGASVAVLAQKEIK